MFLAIEGFDGSGKNSTSNALYEALKQDFSCRLIDKNECFSSDVAINSVAKKLQEIIYDQIPQTNYNKFSKQFWVTIQGSWFQLICDEMISSSSSDCELLISSGWYYKFFSKYLMKGVDEAWMQEVFKYISVPDLIIVLDVDPAISFERRPGYTPTESGYLDGYSDKNPKTSFVNYQNQLLCFLKESLSGRDNVLYLSDLTEGRAPDVNGVVDAISKIIRDRLNV